MSVNAHYNNRLHHNYCQVHAWPPYLSMSSNALKYSLKKVGVNLFSPLHILMIATDPLHSNVTELAVDECLSILLLVDILKNELITDLEGRKARAA